MAILNATNPRFQIIDSLGNPLVGGKVYVYEAGTTTALTNWTDAVKTAVNTQPVILDSTGSADIWFEQSAKIDVKTSDDVQVEGFPVDDIASNISGVISGNFNLVQNGSFEIDSNADNEPDNWTLVVEANGTIAIDNTDQTHGFNSLKFDGGGSGAGSATSTKFDVLESGEVSVQFTYKASLATTTTAAMLNWYNSSDAFISATTIHDDTGTNPTSFTTFNYVATAPATAVRAELELKGVPAGGAQLSADVWFDDIIVQGASSAVTLKATQTLENKTLTSPTVTSPTITSPTVNGENGYGLVVLDTPELLASGVAAVGTWTQYDMSAGGTEAQAAHAAGASIAILKATLLLSHATAASQANAVVYIHKNGLGGTTAASNAEVVQCTAVKDTADTQSGADKQVAICPVNLDANSDFEYQVGTAATTTSWEIYLVGYYV